MEKLSSNNKIDLVVLWVDGNDKEWLAEKNKYLHIKGDAGDNRFRDCENLQYLFRGIDKYAPWVNKVFFITWGHVPSWLDTTNKKLRIVKHEEFIPKEYLPTFNSNVIELNLHRIEDLSERFVLFNDDFFILKETKATDFFEGYIPKDVYVEYTQLASYYNDLHFFMKANILAIINKHFNKHEFYKKYFFKAVNPKYGHFFNSKTLYSMKFKKKFCGFWNFHAPLPYLKDTFKRVWEIEKENLEMACENKFRASTDLGHYLCRYWQFCEGNFLPKKDESKYFIYQNNNDQTVKAIEEQKYKFICINDAYMDIDFEKGKKEINAAFAKIFPNKSQFEK